MLAEVDIILYSLTISTWTHQISFPSEYGAQRENETTRMMFHPNEFGVKRVLPKRADVEGQTLNYKLRMVKPAPPRFPDVTDLLLMAG
jgi:hypothetical protein